ncbi:hybrid sensor histidine kinase/response regulator [Dichelobacter nodosus]|uniref:hybrid sensor histidine kinase/response regulator n=1 Tax=Dichelobacter nodosus TaxID=870 RepID=UPI00107E83DC|nr:Hpt domain-containing protein [Dichelobacter nodosus]TGA64677.1 response regulator [Dichelobacter nodosus]
MSSELASQLLLRVQAEMAKNIADVKKHLVEWLDRPESGGVEAFCNQLTEVSGGLFLLNKKPAAELSDKVQKVIKLLDNKFKENAVDNKSFSDVGSEVAAGILLLSDYINRLNTPHADNTQEINAISQSLSSVFTDGWKKTPASTHPQIDLETYQVLAERVNELIEVNRNQIEQFAASGGQSLDVNQLITYNQELINLFTLLNLKAPQFLLKYSNQMLKGDLAKVNWVEIAQSMLLVEEALQNISKHSCDNAKVTDIKTAFLQQRSHSQYIGFYRLITNTGAVARQYFESLRKIVVGEERVSSEADWTEAARRTAYYGTVCQFFGQKSLSVEMRRLAHIFAIFSAQKEFKETVYPPVVHALVATEYIFTDLEDAATLVESDVDFLKNAVDQLAAIYPITQDAQRLLASSMQTVAPKKEKPAQEQQSFDDLLGDLDALDSFIDVGETTVAAVKITATVDFDSATPAPTPASASTNTSSAAVESGLGFDDIAPVAEKETAAPKASTEAVEDLGFGFDDIAPVAEKETAVPKAATEAVEDLGFGFDDIAPVAEKEIAAPKAAAEAVEAVNFDDVLELDSAVETEIQEPVSQASGSVDVDFFEHTGLTDWEQLSVPESKVSFTESHESAVIDDEIREFFLEEFDEKIVELSDSYDIWTDPAQADESTGVIRRAFHTLKGSGRTVGYEALGECAWQHEQMLNRVLDKHYSVNRIVLHNVKEAICLLKKLRNEETFVEHHPALLTQALIAEKSTSYLQNENSKPSDAEVDAFLQKVYAECLPFAAAAEVDTTPATMPEVEAVDVRKADIPDAVVSNADKIAAEQKRKFLEELNENIRKMDDHLPRWRNAPDNLDYPGNIKQAFSAIGSSSQNLGYESLQELAWQNENLLNDILDNLYDANPIIQDSVEDSVNLLKTMRGETEFIENPQALLSQAKALNIVSQTMRQRFVSARISSSEKPAEPAPQHQSAYEQAAKTLMQGLAMGQLDTEETEVLANVVKSQFQSANIDANTIDESKLKQMVSDQLAGADQNVIDHLLSHIVTHTAEQKATNKIADTLRQMLRAGDVDDTDATLVADHLAKNLQNDKELNFNELMPNLGNQLHQLLASENGAEGFVDRIVQRIEQKLAIDSPAVDALAPSDLDSSLVSVTDDLGFGIDDAVETPAVDVNENEAVIVEAPSDATGLFDLGIDDLPVQNNVAADEPDVVVVENAVSDVDNSGEIGGDSVFLDTDLVSPDADAPQNFADETPEVQDVNDVLQDIYDDLKTEDDLTKKTSQQIIDAISVPELTKPAPEKKPSTHKKPNRNIEKEASNVRFSSFSPYIMPAPSSRLSEELSNITKVPSESASEGSVYSFSFDGARPPVRDASLFLRALDEFSGRFQSLEEDASEDKIEELLDSVYEIEDSLDLNDVPAWIWRLLDAMEQLLLQYRKVGGKGIRQSTPLLKQSLDLIEHYSDDSSEEDAKRTMNSLMSTRQWLSSEIPHSDYEMSKPTMIARSAADIPLDINDDGSIETPLIPDPNVNQEIAKLFHSEALHLLGDSQLEAEQWDENREELNHLDAVRRSMHALKTSATSAGYSAIADLAQGVELITSQILDGQLQGNARASSILAGAIWQSMEMLDSIRDGYLPTPNPYILNHINSFLGMPLPYPAVAENEKRIKERERKQAEDLLAAQFGDDDAAGENAQSDAASVESAVEAETDVSSEVVDEADAEEEVIQGGVPFDESIDPVLVEIFTDEASELIAQAEQLLGQDLKDHTVIEELKRNMHTLKGGARMVGFTVIGDTSHLMESVIEKLADYPDVKHEQAKTLIGLGHESLYNMLDSVLRHEMPEPATQVNCSLELFANQGRFEMPGAEPKAAAKKEKPVEEVAKKEPKAEKAPVKEKAPEVAEKTSDVAKKAELPAEKSSSTPDAEKPAAAEVPENNNKIGNDVQRFVRVDSALLDDMISMTGEYAIVRSRMENLTLASEFNLSELTRIATRIDEQMRRLDNETEAQMLFRRESDTEDDEHFDPLEMDRFTEVQQLSRQLSEAIEDLKNVQETLTAENALMRNLSTQQGVLQRAIQDRLMATQLVRFDVNESRLRRLVRQTAKSLGKEVDLVLEGGGVELERRLVEDILPPLEHMIRNAVGHGIELPQQRVAAGKPASGTIKIKVTAQASNVQVQVIDDGRGFDYVRIREKARSKGWLDPERENDTQYLNTMLLRSGFSTAESLTQISGRGVGLDVVNEMIKQRRGRLSVDSIPGKGTEFVIVLPFSMSIVEVLLVDIGDQRYAAPMNAVAAISHVSKEELQRSFNGEVVYHEYDGMDYRLFVLASYFQSANYEFDMDTDTAPVLFINGVGEPVAFHVEHIANRLEIIVKNVNRQVLNLPGISGATILGDGRVVPVLDLLDLSTRIAGLSQLESVHVVEEVRARQVLVVDDSVTMRKVSTRLLERNDYVVQTAKDGLDAIEVLNEFMPDVILLDIEMPRMDGFEFAAHVRQNAMYNDVPIIMVTSRTGDKHRERADKIGVQGYLGKPYREDVLIETIESLIGGKSHG